MDWLTQRCTCPVCRYELPTDDPDYERSRKERMRHRKPRIRIYELERMSLSELKKMSKEYKIPWPRKIREKKDIWEAFANSGRIEIIAAPKPVEYSLQKLRAMTVSKLKRAMENAGVFFDPIDVLEKEDMVQIFCNSGRVILRQDTPVDDVSEEIKVQAMEVEPIHIYSEQFVETVIEDDDNDGISNKNKDAIKMFDDVDSFQEQIVGGTTEDSIFSPEDNEEGHERSETCPAEVTTDESTINSNLNQESQGGIDHTVNLNNDCEPPPNDDTDVEMPYGDGDHPISDHELASAYQRYESLSISGLRQAAGEYFVDLSNCIERSEMIEKLVRAEFKQALLEEDFGQWSVSDIRALGAAIQVDLNDCHDRMSMLHRILAEASSRPYVARYIRSLMPLAMLTVPQLLAVARQWHVNVSNCIEREEIFQRLASAAIPSSLN
jgi:hypothetical protein